VFGFTQNDRSFRNPLDRGLGAVTPVMSHMT
jgi:hypothetical protein